MGNVQLGNRRLLTAIIIGIALLVIPAISIFQLLLHHHSVYKTSVELLKGDTSVHDRLGRPIQAGFWVNGRVWQGTASFTYRVSGPRGRTEATAVAVERASLWKMEYILLKQPDGRAFSLPGARGYVAQ